MKKHLYEIKRLDIPAYLKWWFIKYRNAGTLSEILENLTSPITLTNSLKRRFKIFEIGGNSVQDGEPSPINEVPIQNVGDNVNIFDKSSTPIYKDQVATEEIENGVRVITQNTGTYHIALYLIDTVANLKGKDITVSANIVPSSSNLGGLGIILCDANGSNRTAIAQKNSILGKQTLTAKIDESYDNNKVIALRLYSNLESAATGDYVDYKELKVEEGTVATGYSAYNCGSADVNVENENLWDEKWEIGEINGTTGIKVNTGEAIRSKNYIKVTPNQAYYFYIGTTNYMNVYQYDSNKNYIGALTGKRNEIITLSNKCYYILFATATSYGTVYNNNICINLSNPEINGNYFEHEEQTAIFPLEEGQVFHASDTIEDKIIQRRKTLVLDGTEEWVLTNAEVGQFRLAINDMTKNPILSNYFGYKLSYSASGKPYLRPANGSLFAEIGTEFLPEVSVVAWKNWLAEKYANGTPVTLEYELETPLEIPFTEAQRTAKAQIDSLHSYKGTTYISSDNIPSPLFKIQYVKEET